MNEQQTAQFRATSGDFQGFGVTPQEALNALLSRLNGEAPTPIVIWPYNRSDVFFSAEQQARLQDLKNRRDTLTEAERQEWECLAEATVEASTARVRAINPIGSVYNAMS